MKQPPERNDYWRHRLPNMDGVYGMTDAEVWRDPGGTVTRVKLTQFCGTWVSVELDRQGFIDLMEFLQYIQSA